MSVNIYSNGKLNKIAGKGESTKIVNNLTETIPGKALDATQGKILNDKIKTNSDKLDIIINEGQLGITTEAKGKEITVNDSTNAKLVSFNLHGQSEQNSYSGKNLVDSGVLERSENGITWKWNHNHIIGYGTITSGGSISNRVPYTIKDKQKQYTISVTGKKENCGTYITLAKEDGTGFKTFQYADPLTINCKDYPELHSILLNMKRKDFGKVDCDAYLQIEEGSSATSYEPYVGTKPSPSPDYPQDIITSGESYNLLENVAESKTENGITFTKNADGSVKLNGTNINKDTFIILNSNMVLKSGKYILSSGVSPLGNTVFLLAHGVDGSGSWHTTTDGDRIIDVNKTSTITIAICVRPNQKVDNLTFYPMIRKATETRTRYMPYKKGSVEVISGGKNLLKNTMAKNGTVSGLSWETQSDGRIIVNGSNTNFDTQITVGDVFLKKGEKIIISKGISDNKFLVLYFKEDFHVYNKVVKVESATSEIPKDGIYRYYIKINKTQVCNNDVFYPMVRSAKFTDDTYEPYKAISSIIPTPDGLAGIKVTSGGNYTDENGQQWITDELVKYEDGSGKYIKRIGKEVFDGSEDEHWSAEHIPGDHFRYGSYKLSNLYTVPPENNDVIPTLLCNLYKAVNNSNAYFYRDFGITIHPTNTKLYVIDEYYSETNKLEEFKQMLSTNNMILYYSLKTPQETPLSSEQMAEIEKLKTFYPTTHITNDGVCGIEMKYHVDQKNYIDGQIAIMKAQQEQNLLNTLLLMPEETQAKMIENDTNNILKEVQ